MKLFKDISLETLSAALEKKKAEESKLDAEIEELKAQEKAKGEEINELTTQGLSYEEYMEKSKEADKIKTEIYLKTRKRNGLKIPYTSAEVVESFKKYAKKHEAETKRLSEEYKKAQKSLYEQYMNRVRYQNEGLKAVEAYKNLLEENDPGIEEIKLNCVMDKTLFSNRGPMNDWSAKTIDTKYFIVADIMPKENEEHDMSMMNNVVRLEKPFTE